MNLLPNDAVEAMFFVALHLYFILAEWNHLIQDIQCCFHHCSEEKNSRNILAYMTISMGFILILNAVL